MFGRDVVAGRGCSCWTSIGRDVVAGRRLEGTLLLLLIVPIDVVVIAVEVVIDIKYNK